METMDWFTSSCAIIAIAIVLGSSILLKCKSQTKNEAPKARGGWPIIGHLPLLSSDALPHRLLGTMADTHGPIFRIKLGVKEALVISSKEMAKECLVKNDSAVLDRGKSVGMELTSYNYAMFGFSPYGPYWRRMRKIATLHLLSKDRCNALAPVFESEVSKSVRKMYAQWWMAENGNPTAANKAVVLVDLTKVIAQFTFNLSVRAVFGVQLDEEDDEEEFRILEAIKDVTRHMGSYTIGDALPFMRLIVDLGGQEKAMKKCFKELDNIVQRWLDEHKRNRCDSKLDQDIIMRVMLSILDDDDAIKDADYDADTINKATCLVLLLGGSDTTKVTLSWAFSLLLNNPEVMKKAKEELNFHIGKERQVSISDIPKLVYIEAIVKETLRLYPPAPLSGPREFTKDCTISNYHVKNGTQLIVNVSKISRDPRVWDCPLEFRPERFFATHNNNVDVKGHHLELIPFGVGRRMCPGISFALQGLHLFLATLLHAFEFSTQHNALVDMTESFGLTVCKAKPLYVLLAPTLPSQAYGS